jgi:MoaA/NifB/PqqE/SkfB family radical SAM enzyme
MPREDFELFLGRLSGHGELLYFHVKGEPLLHPALGDFLGMADERGFPVSLTTNGTLLGERAAELLAAANIRKLSVSLHSHAGAIGVDEYWRGVSGFLDSHRLSRPFPVSLRLWNRGADGLPPEDERLWELVRARYPEAGAWASASERGRSRRLDESVYLNQAERFEWPGLALPASGERGFCLALRNQAAVLVDGTVVPCCLDGEGAMTLGSLRDSSLAEILASPRARAIYDGFTRRELVEPLCRTCGYRRRFASALDRGERRTRAT